MSNEEHYFENLLYDGRDINYNPNKNAISKDNQRIIEMCADYVLYTIFFNREDFLEFIKERKIKW